MREHIAADEPFVREDVPGRRGARALQGRGPGLQGRADRGPRSATRASRRSRSTPTARSPTCAAGRTRRRPSASARSSCSRSPAPTGAATPTARCSRASTAPRSSSRPSSRSTSSGSSWPARATTASSGRELGLFTLLAAVAGRGRSGCPTARRCSTRWSTLVGAMQHAARGYREVKTPHALRRRAVEALRPLGQVPRQHVLHRVEDREIGLKPMNCPGALRSSTRMQRRSYRDLPVRYAEPGLVHRHEPSGTLHGLLRVRHITQDDAHIFCTEEQIEDEVRGCLDFGFDDLRDVRLRAARSSCRRGPTKRLGDRRAVGPAPRRRWPGALERQRPRRTRSTRARAPSTARRSTST